MGPFLGRGSCATRSPAAWRTLPPPEARRGHGHLLRLSGAPRATQGEGCRCRIDCPVQRETGEVVIEPDMRFTPLSDCPAEERESLKMVLGWHRYSLGHQAGSDDIPIAAYMIPPDLKPGKLVLVEDTIALVASSIDISQGGVSGYGSALALRRRSAGHGPLRFANSHRGWTDESDPVTRSSCIP
jgi:hypothetical protein